MNRTHGKNVGGALSYAPDFLVTESGGVIINPTNAQYLAQGWKLVVDVRPVKSGYTYTHNGFDEDETTITWKWSEAEVEKSPRTIDRVKLIGACTAMGIWDALKTWMQESTISVGGVDVPVYDAYLAADDARMTEGTELFDTWFEAAKAALGLTDAQGEMVKEGAKKE